MRRLRVRVALLALLPILLLAIGCILLPWKSWLATRLEQMLDRAGIHHATFVIDDIGPRHVLLRDLAIGDDRGVKLENLSLAYKLSDLWHRRLSDITVKNLYLSFLQDQGKWRLSGLTMAAKTSPDKPFAVPVAPDFFSGLPFSTLKVTDSRLTVQSPDLTLHAGWRSDFHVTLVPTLTAAFNGLQAARGEMRLAADALTLQAQLVPNRAWTGQWALKNLALKNGASAWPLLSGSGQFTVQPASAFLAGAVKSADNAYHATFSLRYYLPGKTGLLTVTEASVPWSQGRLAIHNVQMPVGIRRAITINVEFQHLSVGTLLQSATGKRVSATGFISGSLPVIVDKQGGVSFGQGLLSAEAPGQITMPPEALPGDSREIVILRDVLKNFQYQTMAITVTPDAQGNPSLTLALAGRNPDAYDGRAVSLNVHLAGDVLNFLKQNIALMTDPKSMLKQDKR